MPVIESRWSRTIYDTQTDLGKLNDQIEKEINVAQLDTQAKEMWTPAMLHADESEAWHNSTTELTTWLTWPAQNWGEGEINLNS